MRNPIVLCEYVESLVAENDDKKFYLFIDEVQFTQKIIDKENGDIEVTIYDMLKVEINHFVDCVVNSTECIVKTDEAVKLMQIIDAIYMSAQTGKTIYFD